MTILSSKILKVAISRKINKNERARTRKVLTYFHVYIFNSLAHQIYMILK